MFNDIKKTKAFIIAIGMTTSLLLVAIINGYDFTFMKILALFNVLIFLISNINLMILEIKNIKNDDDE